MTLRQGRQTAPLKKVAKPSPLAPGTWLADGATLTACFDLPKGKSVLEIAS